MIRMGRSSKPEATPENAAYPRTNENNGFNQTYQPGEGSTQISRTGISENAPTATRALAESEAMARDIKEGRLSGFVGSGTTLNGETNFRAMLRVDGHLTGKVMSDGGTLIVGSTGRVDANILVGAAVVNGAINGDIYATERVELGRNARVIGNIQTPSMMIEQGAIFEGNCSMVKARAEAEKRVRQQAEAAQAARAEVAEPQREAQPATQTTPEVEQARVVPLEPAIKVGR